MIVKVAPNETQYLDRKFWNEGMQEQMNDSDSHVRTIPVQVMGLRVDWVFKQQGRDFLYQVSTSSNLEFFNVPFLQMVIFFLYEKLKYILRALYIIQFLDLGVMAAVITIHENLAELKSFSEESSNSLILSDIGHYRQALLVLIALSFLLLCVNCIDMGLQLRNYFEAMWSRSQSGRIIRISILIGVKILILRGMIIDMLDREQIVEVETFAFWLNFNRFVYILALYLSVTRAEFFLRVEDGFNYIYVMFDDILAGIQGFLFFLVLQVAFFSFYVSIFGQLKLYY